jgi:hypothetical protein
MTVADLTEMNMLYARWANRAKNKLKWFDEFLIRERLLELGLDLPPWDISK